MLLWLRQMGYAALCSIWSTCNLAPIWRDALSRLIDKWLTCSTVWTRLSAKTNACTLCPCSSLTMRALPSLIIRKLNLKYSVSRSDRCNPPQCIACLRMRVFVNVSSLCLLYFSWRENIGSLFVLHLIEDGLRVREARSIFWFSSYRLVSFAIFNTLQASVLLVSEELLLSLLFWDCMWWNWEFLVTLQQNRAKQ
jgi:hypothetical protein